MRDIEVWLIALPDDPVEASALSAAAMSVLSCEEREKAARFHAALDRARYLEAHLALREVLADRSGQTPAEVKYGYGPQGKPRLESHPAIHFNLSHGGGWAVVALADRPVGVDIEPVAPFAHLDEVAAGVLHGEERAALHARPDRLLEGFFRAWVRKEAVLKYAGLGLSRAPNTVKALPWTPGPIVVDLIEPPDRVWVHDVAVDETHACAVATATLANVRVAGAWRSRHHIRAKARQPLKNGA
jgi:4'-phosphopantetheinyl transferase